MTQQLPLERRAIVRWVRAGLVLFLMMGLGFGTWLSRLPSVRDELDASTIEMSLYGLTLAAGSLAGMFISGGLIERVGPRRVMLVAVGVQIAALPAAIALMLAGLIPLGLACLMIYGLTFSSTDVAMNVSGANAERLLGLPRLPLMHACYSIGTMLAMALGTLAELLRVALAPHFIVVSAIIGACCFAVLRWTPHDESAVLSSGLPALLDTSATVPVVESATGDQLATTTGSIPVIPIPAASVASQQAGSTSPAPSRRYSAWRNPRVLLIGLITLSAGLIEGAPADWLPLALVDGRGVGNEVGTLMLGLFFGSVVTARLGGSMLLQRLGRVAVLRGSMSLAAVGILTVILMPHPAAMVLGTIAWGLGAGICWPITISAAADRPKTAVRDVAAVSALGYTSMLLGPMAFGFIGEHTGLLPAFLVLPLFAILGVLIAGVARPHEPADGLDGSNSLER